MAHGLYATLPAYRQDVPASLAKLPESCVASMRSELLDLGYPDDWEIIWGEIHAYLVDGSRLGTGKAATVEAVRAEIQNTFRRLSVAT